MSRGVELTWPGKAAALTIAGAPPGVLRAVERYEHDALRLAQGAVSGPQGELRHQLSAPSARRVSPAEPGWANQLIWGDNLTALRAMLPTLRGQVTLAYLDPPFSTGHTFRLQVPVGDTGRTARLPAYDDAFGAELARYLDMITPRLVIIRELLSEEGSLIVHCDHRVVHALGLLLDELFGPGDRGGVRHAAGFRNQIAWLYGLGGSSPRSYPKKHDSLLWYTKGAGWVFEAPRVPATSLRLRGKDKKCPDYFDIPSLNNMASERTGYPTQKPEALLARLIQAHSRPSDLVLDGFAGSGTSLVAAARLGRRFVGCEQSALGVRIALGRLLQLHAEAPQQAAVGALAPHPLELCVVTPVSEADERGTPKQLSAEVAEAAEAVEASPAEPRFALTQRAPGELLFSLEGVASLGELPELLTQALEGPLDVLSSWSLSWQRIQGEPARHAASASGGQAIQAAPRQGHDAPTPSDHPRAAALRILPTLPPTPEAPYCPHFVALRSRQRPALERQILLPLEERSSYALSVQLVDVLGRSTISRYLVQAT